MDELFFVALDHPNKLSGLFLSVWLYCIFPAFSLDANGKVYRGVDVK